jgi:bifunctional UDP-N-acetylglucosamine pyrophosphorylase/glucosamine-1-phosphate N-acetyltransferase
VWQREQLGTGHAALMAREALQDAAEHVLIVPGDTPLLSGDLLTELLCVHAESKAAATLASAIVEDATGYGRIVRDADGSVRAIVEHKDATETMRSIREINASVYCFRTRELLESLPLLKNTNAQGEYYLTDTIGLIRGRGGWVQAKAFDDPAILMGVNDRVQLADAEATMRQRILRRHMLAGVTIVDPHSTYIGPDVEIGTDCIVEPSTIITGVTQIGSGSRIGPFSRVDHAQIGRNCSVQMSVVSQARMKDGARCGPFAHLRPGAVIGEKSKIGNFVEIKNSELGEGVAAGHLSYLGDAQIGAFSNIGAGTITCNYDGFAKHRTEVGERVFIGSNSSLVAPLRIGKGAMIAAASVITVDIPEDGFGIGRSRTEVKEQWVAQWRKRRQPEPVSNEEA